MDKDNHSSADNRNIKEKRDGERTAKTAPILRDSERISREFRGIPVNFGRFRADSGINPTLKGVGGESAHLVW
ncbi:MAG: hypothetical protein MPJ52_01495 [Alphaproteobacteria bacterium]|nr:hypothetical protein [Alphaproteobacteria bacterium]MDA7987087.1 hypothetical protein [Alphaproteobacteria bacterium]